MGKPYQDATCVAVHDGDTVTLNIEYPYAPHEWVTKQTAVRLLGIQAAELPSDKGNAARDFLATQIINRRVSVQCDGNDKYGGRIDGVIYMNGQNINELMISEGHAVRWDGKGPKPIG